MGYKSSNLIGVGFRGLAALAGTGVDASVDYQPLRPPAVPLAVRTPYMSTWSSGALNEAMPKFWTGAGLGWLGIVTVDGISYGYLGNGFQGLPETPNFQPATPLGVTFDAHHSNYTFEAGDVTILASFFSPVLPSDTCRTSVPLSYLTTSIESRDNRTHDVQFYSDIGTTWLDLGGDENSVQWEILRDGTPMTGIMLNASLPMDGIYSWSYQSRNPAKFHEWTDLPQWGSVVYSTSPMGAHTFQSASGSDLKFRYSYIVNTTFSANADFPTQGLGGKDAVFAFLHGFVGVSSAQVRYTVGSIQDPIIKFLGQSGIIELVPWWKHCYQSQEEMILFHWKDFDTSETLAGEMRHQLRTDIDLFYFVRANDLENNSSSSDVNNPSAQESSDTTISGFSEAEAYHAIVALSARQVMAASVLALSPSYEPEPSTTEPQPVMFMKEISSDGNINTLDILYPASPFFLYSNPSLLRYALQPLYEIRESSLYPNDYSMHDLGSNFPNATGHVRGDDEYMPVEECGNIILMSYAYYKFTGDAAWLRSHYKTLKDYGRYLVEFSLMPQLQMSTDDFNGELANQTNLAIKGIVALQAMSAVAELALDADAAALYANKAKEYYAGWEELAIEPSGEHTMLSYQWTSSWGILYNAYYDKLLNLGVINQSVYSIQSDWYAKVSQVYGVPLDNRHPETKSDWQIWAAASSSSGTRRTIIRAMASWLNNTSSLDAFSDHYETFGAGDSVGFKARPVVGGHFALLALVKSGQLSLAEGGSTTGSFFDRGGTGFLHDKGANPSRS